MTIFGLVLAIAVLSLLAPVLHRFLQKPAGLLLTLGMAGIFAWFALQIPRVAGGEVLQQGLAWVPSLGVELSFRLDGLSLLFALLITGIGALILLYATGYLGKHRDFGRFLALILLFAAAMLGLVLADNLIVLFVFWELTSISSYLLIGFNHNEAKSRRNALQALLVTGAGGVALLAGLILLGIAAGSFEMSEILAAETDLTTHAFYPGILFCLLLGAFTKSAQFPFHFWLPNAMAAPTPVSAYLHSATMVKAGIYLLLRMHPVLGDSVAWFWSLTIAGGITMLLAGITGLFQTDLKKILAYTTCSVLGILTMLIGLGTEMAIKSALVFLLGHALYKACLFMCAGSVDHEAHTRDVTILGGLRGAMPLTAAAAGLAALSKAGFPPFFGFIGKELVYKSGLGIPMESFSPVLMTIAVCTNMLLLALAFKVGIHPFWAKPAGNAGKKLHAHEAPWTMWLGPVLLAGLGLVCGLMPVLMIKPLIAPAAYVAFGGPVEIKLALWHGLNLPLLLSGVTVAGGVGLYFSRRLIWQKKWGDFSRTSLDHGYDRALEAIMALARRQTTFFQNGYLRNYLLTILSVTILLLGWKLFLGEEGIGLPATLTPIGPLQVVLVLGMIGAAIAAVLAQSRLTTLLCLGFVGFGVALLFALLSAPDLAITQVLVETLIVVLFMFVVYKLPRFRQFSKPRVVIADAVFSAVFGLLITLLVLKAKVLQIGAPLSERYAEISYLEAKGKNVVNVILVDFRALDTLGEITVLAIAALGIFALMSRGKSDNQKGDVDPS